MIIRHPQASESARVRDLVEETVYEVYGGVVPRSVSQFQNQDFSQAWIAVVNSTITGMIATSNQWIDDLWIRQECRKKGIGRELLLYGEHKIRGRGFRTANLRLVKENTRAIDFYEKHGWKVDKEFKHETFLVSMLQMSKELDYTCILS